MRLVVFMHDSESITARIHIFIREDFVTNDVDISLDLRFLYSFTQCMFIRTKPERQTVLLLLRK